MWGRVVQEEETASAKALRQEKDECVQETEGKPVVYMVKLQR